MALSLSVQRLNYDWRLETNPHVDGVSGSTHKLFATEEEAYVWLQTAVLASPSPSGGSPNDCVEMDWDPDVEVPSKVRKVLHGR